MNYVLAHDYMRGTEGNQSWMFGSNDIVTRAQAAVILMQLQSHMKQLVGAPKSVTSEKKLPERLFPEVQTDAWQQDVDCRIPHGRHAISGRTIWIYQHQNNFRSGKILDKFPVETVR